MMIAQAFNFFFFFFAKNFSLSKHIHAYNEKKKERRKMNKYN